MDVSQINFMNLGKCPYLPERDWSILSIESDYIQHYEYENLLNIGFRKNGNTYYLPKCLGCDECRPLRVPVNKFKMSSRQKKILKKNDDITLEIARPSYSEEKFSLYKKYLQVKHCDDLSYDVEESYKFNFFLATSYSIEMTYYLGNKIIAIGFLEVLRNSTSSVYFYYDTDYSNRSLGTYSALKEIEFTRNINLEYFHLGYYVHNCGAMSYKSRFKPFDILYANRIWVDGEQFVKEFHGK